MIKKYQKQLYIAAIFAFIELLVIFAYNNFIENIKSSLIFANKELLQITALYFDKNNGKAFLLTAFGLLLLLFLLKAFNTYKGKY
ncbi:MAG: hypothetical protein PF487_10015 [Bacteroidales bacterium]|jgi:hypothetical protein|nr:hypothetical protein [Bacteroidales bacterium]